MQTNVPKVQTQQQQQLMASPLSSSSFFSSSSSSSELRKGFSTLKIVQNDSVFHIYITLPNNNALTHQFFAELPRALHLLDHLTPSARTIVLSSRGPHFCSGIDLSILASINEEPDDVTSRFRLRHRIAALQASITAIEQCRKPVIAAVHGACVGGGVDLIAACDIRYCSEESFFSVMEVDTAMAADLGTLQRLPSIVGYGRTMELALTGRRVTSSEAKEIGLVSRVWVTRAEMVREVGDVARGLAAKAAVAVAGTKAVMVRSRELGGVERGLDYVATWNAGVIVNRDLEEAVRARKEKRRPVFTCKI